MDIIIDLNSPSKISKIAELAAEMMARGGKLTLSISMSDNAVSSVMGSYFEWAGVISAPVAQSQPQPSVAQLTTPPAPVAQAAPAQMTPPAPAPAQPTPGGAGVGALFDSRGTPYNPDLHAALTGRTAGKNDAGEWKMKRGVDRAAYDAWRVQAGAGQSQSQPQPQPQPQPQGFPVNPFAASAPAPVLNDPGEAAVSQKASQLTMSGVLTPAIINALQMELQCDTNAFLKVPEMRAIIWERLIELENSSHAG
jgi:hypothetical protein